MKLKPRELELIDAMLKVYFNMKRAAKRGEMDIKLIDDRLGDPMGRKVIRDLINMSEASHNNHFAALKKKNVLTPEGNLQKFLKDLDTQNQMVSYKINIKAKDIVKEVIKETTKEKVA